MARGAGLQLVGGTAERGGYSHNNTKATAGEITPQVTDLEMCFKWVH